MTELRPFTVRDGIEAVRALRVLCAEVAMEANLSHATHHAWSEATALLLRVSNDQIDFSGNRLGEGAVRAVVEKYGRLWAKDSDYYAAAEALGIKEPPDAL